MAQRVAIARALAGEPRLLIADEPTTALDVTVQAEILDLLRELQQERKMAILLITHDWGVIADLCDRAIVMYAGEIVEHAGLTELFREPRHPYTEALLGSNPHHAPESERLPSIPAASRGRERGRTAVISRRAAATRRPSAGRARSRSCGSARTASRAASTTRRSAPSRSQDARPVD